MTKVSVRKLHPIKAQEIEKEFWEIVADLKTSREAELFFRDLLTHTERKMMVKRLRIAKMLTTHAKYREISEEVKVTPNTIAKINNWLDTFGDGYRLAIERKKRGR